MLSKCVKAIFGVSLAGYLSMGTAIAATYTVTKTADTNDGICDSDCSLREAVIAANTIPGADTINVAAGAYSLTLVGAAEEFSATGDLDIYDDVVINGAGAMQTFIDGYGQDRIFYIVEGVNVEIKNLSVMNGLVFDEVGGGIFNQGNTTVKNVRFENNVSFGYGGAIESRSETGHLVIDSSYFRNNCSFSGGAVELASRGAIIVNSIFDGNVPVTKGGFDCINGDGAAIHQQYGTTTIDKSSFINNVGEVGAITGYFGSLTLTNSVIANNRGLSGNYSPTGPGGILVQGRYFSVTIVNSTITSNTGFLGGGGVAGPMRLINSIVANNTAPFGPDCYDLGYYSSGNPGYGPVSDGNNIFGTVAECGLTLQSTDSVTNPGLGALATDSVSGQSYHPLLAGSPAIDAGNNASCPATDHLGTSRPLDGDGNGIAVCDIGAHEYSVASNTAYRFDGFIAPLKDGGVYKLGGVIPVKIQLSYADGTPVTTATPTLAKYLVSNNVVSATPVDISSVSAADSGNTLRYTGENGIYIYNLNTKSAAIATYKLSVTLGDGTPPRSIIISFK